MLAAMAPVLRRYDFGTHLFRQSMTDPLTACWLLYEPQYLRVIFGLGHRHFVSCRYVAIWIQGMFRLQVWVDLSFVPFGMTIVIGCFAICLFTTGTGAPSMMKWLVAPESETAHLSALVRNF